MNRFKDYLWLLLPSALKKVGKKSGQWWTFCRVLGVRFDQIKDILLDVRENTMVATCDPLLLPVFGREREMPRLKGETVEGYRLRLMMKANIAERAGTAEGIVAMVKALGYETVYLEPLYLTDRERWAEATCWISGGKLVIDDRAVVQQEIDRVKSASSKVLLAHERIQNGAVYIGVVTQNSKIIDMRQV